MCIKVNDSNTQAFVELREEAGFKPYSFEDVQLSLKNSFCHVVAYEDNVVIGVGRVVGDGRTAFFIKDVIVSKNHQSKKIGVKIMHELLRIINECACDNAYVGLMSTPGKENFYKQFGFLTRPNEQHGAGMILYIKKDESIHIS